jgi:ribonuclease P protein component
MSAFPQSRRLKTKPQFDLVFGGAERVSSAHWTLLWRARASGRARLGLAIAKKADPRAVGRNRIKRIARETFRLALAKLPPIDLIALIKPAARSADNTTLRDEFADGLRRVERRFAARHKA